MLQLRLVDRALAAELGLERLDRDAVRLLRAVAAALADQLVDEDALRRVGELAALAPAPLLGGAGLVVDQHGEARRVAELALDRVEVVAVADLDARREAGAHRVFLGLVGDHHDALGALRPPPGWLICGTVMLALGGLAAGHRDGVVEEDLVGDVDAGRRRGADREQAANGIGAVAEVLEDVLLAGERRLADPVGAFAAHVGAGRGAARRHPDRHGVAADAGAGAAALGHLGRGVVRAARAEEGRALRLRRAARRRSRCSASSRAMRWLSCGALAVEPPQALRPARAPPWWA